MNGKNRANGSLDCPAAHFSPGFGNHRHPLSQSASRTALALFHTTDKEGPLQPGTVFSSLFSLSSLFIFVSPSIPHPLLHISLFLLFPFPCSSIHYLSSLLSYSPLFHTLLASQFTLTQQTDMNRQASAPLLANEDPRDSFDDQERELLKEESRKQISRVRPIPKNQHHPSPSTGSFNNLTPHRKSNKEAY